MVGMASDVVRSIETARRVTNGDSRDLWLSATRHPANFRREGFPAHFTASAVPVTADASHVCLVHHVRIGQWVQPGGHLEPADLSVMAAASRELREETGLAGQLDSAPLLLSRHPAPCGTARWHLDLQFLAVVEKVEPIVSEESHDAAWFPVDRLPANLAGGVDDLVESAVEALRRSGSPTRSAPAR